jgi:long-chain acyl-CoA synthetase
MEVKIMASLFYKKRIEENIADAWKGRESDNCLWWQGNWWTWCQLNDLAVNCETKLKEKGFSKGERIAILLPNSPMFFALSLAVWRLGGTVAPLNGRLDPVRLMSTIKMLDVSAVFVLDGKLADPMKAENKMGVPIAMTPVDSPILRDFKMRRGIPEDGDTAVIFSTSGTSGLPKAVPCTHSNILGNMDDVPYAAPGIVSTDSVFLNVLPNFHALGCNTSGYLPLLFGARQAVMPSFIPVANTIEAIKAANVNIIIAVPTLMSFILADLAKNNERIEGVKFIVCGGDKLNPQLDERCQKYFGVGILEGYGLTECSPIVAFNPSMQGRKLGTVGPKFGHLDAEIHDRNGKCIGLHEEGILWLKGPAVVSRYFRDEANTKERFHDGWFDTGDVVRIDDDGYITIVDRATDIIIVGGFNVYPQEVEAVLCSHPAVRAAVAVGEPNSVTGELVKAFIILRDGVSVTPKEIIDYCRARLAHYKVPRQVAFVKEYPLSPTGKVLRRELRKIKIENKY